MALKDYKLKNTQDKHRSPRWIQKDKEYAIFVQVNNTFVGDRKPEVNIWKQQKDQKNMADYILSGKKFDTKKEAIAFAKRYMKEN